MQVGITSLEDWPMFTWSLGWTLLPGCPRICVARLPMTSLALVLVEVPDPVWKMSTTKWSIQTSAGHLLGGLNNSLGQVRLQQLQLHVAAGGSQLYEAEGADEGPGEPQVADGEIQYGPHCGCAVKGIDWDFHRAHRVAFRPSVPLCSHLGALPRGLLDGLGRPPAQAAVRLRLYSLRGCLSIGRTQPG